MAYRFMKRIKGYFKSLWKIFTMNSHIISNRIIIKHIIVVIIGVREAANTHKDISKAIYQGKDISTFFSEIMSKFWL